MIPLAPPLNRIKQFPSSSSVRPGTDFTVLVVTARDWTGKAIRICEIRRFQYLSQQDLKAELRDLIEKRP